MLSIEEIRAACARSEPVQFADPYLSQIKMPLRETFYPLGFPLQIETNCEEVLISAAASWQGFVKLFDTVPIRVRVHVYKRPLIGLPSNSRFPYSAASCLERCRFREFFHGRYLAGIRHNLAHRGGRGQSRLSSLLLSGIYGNGCSRRFARYGDSRGLC